MAVPALRGGRVLPDPHREVPGRWRVAIRTARRSRVDRLCGGFLSHPVVQGPLRYGDLTLSIASLNPIFPVVSLWIISMISDD